MAVQRAGLEALTGSQDAVRDMVAAFRRRRELIVDGLNAIDGITCLKPKGAFYVYADISSSLRPSEDSRAWCTSLLEEARVAITPGWDFDRVHGGSTVRLSLAVGPEQVAEAMTRLRSWLAGR